MLLVFEGYFFSALHRIPHIARQTGNPVATVTRHYVLLLFVREYQVPSAYYANYGIQREADNKKIISIISFYIIIVSSPYKTTTARHGGIKIVTILTPCLFVYICLRTHTYMYIQFQLTLIDNLGIRTYILVCTSRCKVYG